MAEANEARCVCLLSKVETQAEMLPCRLTWVKVPAPDIGLGSLVNYACPILSSYYIRIIWQHKDSAPSDKTVDSGGSRRATFWVNIS